MQNPNENPVRSERKFSPLEQTDDALNNKTRIFQTRRSDRQIPSSGTRKRNLEIRSLGGNGNRADKGGKMFFEIWASSAEGSLLLIKCERSQMGSCLGISSNRSGVGSPRPFYFRLPSLIWPMELSDERENIKSDKLNKIFLLRVFHTSFGSERRSERESFANWPIFILSAEIGR